MEERISMETYKLADIKPDTVYNGDVIIDKTFLLCSASCPVTQDMLRALLEWNFDHVIKSDTSITTISGEAEQAEATAESAKEKKPEPQKKASSQASAPAASFTRAAPQDIVEKENTAKVLSSNPEIREALSQAKEKATTTDHSRMELV